MRLEASVNLFWVIFASKLTDDEAMLFILAKLFDSRQNWNSQRDTCESVRNFRFYIYKSVKSLPAVGIKMALLEQL